MLERSTSAQCATSIQAQCATSGNTPFFDGGLEIRASEYPLTHEPDQRNTALLILLSKLGIGHPTVMSRLTFCEVVLPRQIHLDFLRQSARSNSASIHSSISSDRHTMWSGPSFLEAGKAPRPIRSRIESGERPVRSLTAFIGSNDRPGGNIRSPETILQLAQTVAIATDGVRVLCYERTH